ncbi:MAG: ArnT family glycosyltransferase [Acidobacteriaceae bacterium]
MQRVSPGTKPSRYWLNALLALAAGLALRLWLIHHDAQIQDDSLIYGAIAKNWLLHGVYGLTKGHSIQPTLIRLPGYPLYLAICFRLFGVEHYNAVLYTEAIMDLGTCLLVGLLVRNLLGPRLGMLAIWLAALCPFTATYTLSPLTEVPSIFCVALALYALERWSHRPATNLHFWLLAVAFCYAILLRPDGGLVAAAFGPAMAWFAWKQLGTPRAFRRMVLFAFLTLLPLAPWTYRNWRDFHVIQPLAPKSATDPGEFVPNGFNRWFRTWGIDYASNEKVYWNAGSDSIEIHDLPTRAFDNQQQYNETAALLNDYNQHNIVTPQLDARFDAIAQQRIVHNHLRYYVLLPLARLADMWLRPRTEILPVSTRWWQYSEHHEETELALAYGLLNVLYLLLALLGAWRLYRHMQTSTDSAAWMPLFLAMLGYVLLRCLLLLTLDNSEPRYTLECYPIVFVLAAAAFMGRKQLSQAEETAGN